MHTRATVIACGCARHAEPDPRFAQRRPVPHWLLACTIAFAWTWIAGIAVAADVLVMADGTQVEGTFTHYKGGQFVIQVGEGRPRKIPLVRVKSLNVAPPVDARLRRHAGKNLDGLTFNGYNKPEFNFTRDGQPLNLPSAQVAAIDPASSLQREMQHVAEIESADSAQPHDATFEIPIATGRVTAVHFHRDDVMSSVRQGNYLRSVCDQSNGKLVYVRIPIQGRNDPIALRYQISTIPQFWFYDREGEISGKLTERFTEEDIDRALNEAR